MAAEIIMPSLSPTMEKGSIAKWRVREGDAVKAGDVLAEIETDKASMEFEAAEDGIVSRIVVAAGTEDVPVGALIALIGDAADAPARGMQGGSQDVAGPGPAEDTGLAAAPLPPMPSEVPHAPPMAILDTAPVKPSLPATAVPSSTKASPLARRIAGAKGIDLGQIRGSGRDGKILRIDLNLPRRAGMLDAAPTPVHAAAPTPIHPPPTGVPHETVKLSGMRRTIARRLTESKQTVPHFYLNVDVRLDALLTLRGELNASRDASEKLSVNDFLIKALAVALELTPDANVQFGGDQLYRFGRADISVAIAIPGGLVTPVVIDAGNKRVSRIAAEVKDFSARARAGTLAPEEYKGGTASLSNLGMFGMTSIVPVISPPQAVIIGIGAGEQRPVAADGQLALATVLTATASFDHRAIDGAVGAELVRTFKNLIERPSLMLA